MDDRKCSSCEYFCWETDNFKHPERDAICHEPWEKERKVIARKPDDIVCAEYEPFSRREGEPFSRP